MIDRTRFLWFPNDTLREIKKLLTIHDPSNRKDSRNDRQYVYLRNQVSSNGEKILSIRVQFIRIENDRGAGEKRWTRRKTERILGGGSLEKDRGSKLGPPPRQHCNKNGRF